MSNDRTPPRLTVVQTRLRMMTIEEWFACYPISESGPAPASSPVSTVERWRKTSGKSPTDLFRELAAIEPRLNELLAAAREYKRASKGKRRVCANERWYGYYQWRGRALKDRLEKLVGWFAANPRLKTEDAYDMAYHYIYAALPYCRNCLCIGVPQERHS